VRSPITAKLFARTRGAEDITVSPKGQQIKLVPDNFRRLCGCLCD